VGIDIASNRTVTGTGIDTAASLTVETPRRRTAERSTT
jgi:hypothetical protein